MEFIMENITSVLGDQTNHYRSLNANMNRLKRKCEELNCRKEDVESKMKADLKPGKKLKEEVKLWLATVQQINEETQSINEEKQSIENQAAAVRYLEGSRLGKLVAEKIQEVEEHHTKGIFLDGLVVDASPSRGEILPTTALAGETTIKKNMEKIWDCLMNDEIRLIGVYGLGGIGKTSVMKHINNRLLEENEKFDSIFWVTVSKVFDVIKLQDYIASALNEDLSRHECETRRAAKLYSILREKKRYVLILDDVWEAFELENVGIPEPTPNNGCKIVLTTRSLDVCRRMNCNDIKMDLLSEGEAWNLFLDKVGQDLLHTPGLEPIMKLVVKECAHLPLAIVMIARSMRGIVDECEWRNALEELRESTGGLSDMGKVIEQLKYSYIRLKDERLQHCFLYCALYPEDFVIERTELIEYLIVEGLIEGTSMQAKINKGHSILNKLENACLLENYSTRFFDKCVKMHDLIRDMARQIMGCGCMIEAGVQLRDLPDEAQWTKDLEKVSLMHNYIREVPSRASPKCSRLSTLLLSRNRELRRIPDSFFVHMHMLKVLNLAYTGLKNLPNSISDLKNLTTLLLRGCTDLKCVPSLAKLRELRVLDLHRTKIEEVPHGIETLVNLRWLNLHAEDLKMLPAGILPKLSRLQYLLVWWGSETLKVKGSEVADLRQLETFACQFHDLHEFNTYVRSLQGRGPQNYLLQLGSGDPRIYFDDHGGFVTKFSVLKYVVLRNYSIDKEGDDLVVLPKDSESLVIEKCHNARSLCNLISLNNAAEFSKDCVLKNCNGIECVLSSSTSSSYCSPLQRLEKLELIELHNLHILFRGEGASPPPPGTFSRLKDLYINMCPNIQKLFTPEFLPHLQNLERISVISCEGMEEIVAAKEEREEGMGESSKHSIVNNDDSITTITLPKLKTLYLMDLPELKSIVSSRGAMVCDSLWEIHVCDCPKLKTLSLSLPMLNGQPSRPPALLSINVDRQEWWESLEWGTPYAKDVLQPLVWYLPIELSATRLLAAETKHRRIHPEKTFLMCDLCNYGRGQSQNKFLGQSSDP